MKIDVATDYGSLSMRITEILKEKGISKNMICSDLGIPRTNFNRYCRNDFDRIDRLMLCKLCWYLEIPLEELLVYTPPELSKDDILNSVEPAE